MWLGRELAQEITLDDSRRKECRKSEKILNFGGVGVNHVVAREQR